MSAIGSTPAYPVHGQTSAGNTPAAARQPAADQSYQIDETTSAYTDDLSGSAAVSLDADLSGTTSTTEAGWLTLGIAKALQAATSVDSATGHRELIAGAGDQLTQAIDNLLTSAGFTSDEAANATANLSQELAQGGQISLAFTGAHNTSYSNTATFSNGDRSSVFTNTNLGQVSHALTIGIDLDSGALSISLKTHGNGVGQSSELYVNGGFTVENYNQGAIAWETGRGEGTYTTNGTAGSELTETETESSASVEQGTRQIVDSLNGNQSVLNIGWSLVNGQYSQKRSTIGIDQSLFATAPVQQLEQEAPAPTPSDQIVLTNTPGTAPSPKADATSDDALKRLIDNLTDPKIFKENEAASLVARLAAIADGVRAQTKATAEALDKEIAARKDAAKETPLTAAQQRDLDALEAHAQDASAIYEALGSGQGGRQAQIEIGVSQTLAVTQTDAQGHGVTLYKRPDGSLGKFATAPTRVTA
ncbi:hypothetical protein GCM10011611_03340 [Aliidongia dinghuensis]|uniref:Uncharacterized protein n=2 Tax=Aliidongia dinghuensis TaxID=1867774 RepID=A0A8J2YPV1_9PROT|nr:hypothetical protein GCM10011611_03340 [Aliidongia dinghuensis]